MAFYKHDVSNSKLYNESCLLNCDLVEKKEGYVNMLNDEIRDYTETKTNCETRKDTITEHFLFTDQFDLKYRCDATLPSQSTFNDDCLGYECNKRFMYELDEFNTYHNYPVCTTTDEGIACCPKNVQIFNNITRRNNEIPSRVSDSILLFEDDIPKLQYNTCRLYK